LTSTVTAGPRQANETASPRCAQMRIPNAPRSKFLPNSKGMGALSGRGRCQSGAAPARRDGHGERRPVWVEDIKQWPCRGRMPSSRRARPSPAIAVDRV
jgi:hypothetical protein